MIARYHGIRVDIDMLASKGGYRDGMAGGPELQGIYEEVARVGDLRMRYRRRLDEQAIRHEISEGRPVLVWRYFTRERDAFHSRFAESFRADPLKRLPRPEEKLDGRKERENWPDARSGGHASVIDGYNLEREEFLFSESWGENLRHRRMLIEEMESTAYAVWFFR